MLADTVEMHVSDYMTKHPFTIGRHAPLARAHALMREHGVRHLPVVEARRVVGVVSDRDLRVVESLGKLELEVLDVDQAMTPSPYVVAPDAPLHEVVETMARLRYGCAIVCDAGTVAGIFTTTDALAVLANLLWPDEISRPAQALRLEPGDLQCVRGNERHVR